MNFTDLTLSEKKSNTKKAHTILFHKGQKQAKWTVVGS